MLRRFVFILQDLKSFVCEEFVY